MKLLVVLSIKEHQEQVADLLQNTGIKRFSVSNIIGYKKKKENPGWFAANAGDAKTNSIMLFSFTTEEIANKTISKIDKCNEETQNPFPVHAFILDIENFSKFL
ncbi:hypothetical protein [Dysgonomonas sp. BGC7]|uniref:hypothetical protein n=1 Tax=Dysgonomonas sp. BGC7 TaxID=1658008 RepID=UPI00067FA50E|nr:hypothetical protein [Dysgonomonas sp. BGC7]MBD8389303.1 hypothetical protein [Dysgonomonas sp. BGC7]